MNAYKHTQIGYLLIVVFSVVILLISNLVIDTDFNPGTVLLLAFMILCLASFATLTVEVDDQAINIRFGIGLLRKRFLLENVQASRAVKNPLYYAWGIHAIPGGWVFNVSGLQAIELQMRDGRKYRIGTDDAHSLMNAIETNLQKA